MSNLELDSETEIEIIFYWLLMAEKLLLATQTSSNQETRYNK